MSDFKKEIMLGSIPDHFKESIFTDNLRSTITVMGSTEREVELLERHTSCICTDSLPTPIFHLDTKIVSGTLYYSQLYVPELDAGGSNGFEKAGLKHLEIWNSLAYADHPFYTDELIARMQINGVGLQLINDRTGDLWFSRYVDCMAFQDIWGHFWLGSFAKRLDVFPSYTQEFDPTGTFTYKIYGLPYSLDNAYQPYSRIGNVTGWGAPVLGWPIIDVISPETDGQAYREPCTCRINAATIFDMDHTFPSTIHYLMAPQNNFEIVSDSSPSFDVDVVPLGDTGTYFEFPVPVASWLVSSYADQYSGPRTEEIYRTLAFTSEDLSYLAGMKLILVRSNITITFVKSGPETGNPPDPMIVGSLMINVKLIPFPAYNINGMANPGVTFLGWAHTPDKSYPDYIDQYVLGFWPQNNTTLYPVWTPYAIVFDPPSGVYTLPDSLGNNFLDVQIKSAGARIVYYVNASPDSPITTYDTPLRLSADGLLFPDPDVVKVSDAYPLGAFYIYAVAYRGNAQVTAIAEYFIGGYKKYSIGTWLRRWDDLQHREIPVGVKFNQGQDTDIIYHLNAPINFEKKLLTPSYDPLTDSYTFSPTSKHLVGPPNLPRFIARAEFIGSEGGGGTPPQVPPDNGWVWISICWSPELGLFCGLAYRRADIDLYSVTSPDGITWSPHVIMAAAGTPKVFICWSPELHLFCAVGEHILISTNGSTWETILTIRLNSVCWSSEKNEFCAVGGGFLMTSANGRSWVTTPVAPAGGSTGSTGAPPIRWVGVASSADGTKLAAVMYGGSDVWISDDSGGSWTPLSVRVAGEDVAGEFCDIACTPDGTNLIVAGGANWWSTDRGSTWIPPTWGWLENNEPQISVCASVNGFANPNFPDGYQFVSAANNDGGLPGGVRVYTPYYDWRDTVSPWNIPILWRDVASSADGSLIIAVGDVAVWMSFDKTPFNMFYHVRHGDSTWSRVTDLQGGSCVAVSADGTRLFVGTGDNGDGKGGYIYASTDSGNTWSHLTGAGERVWQALAVSADGHRIAAVTNSNPDNFRAGGAGDIYLSSDYGATWSKSTAGTRNWFDVASSADGIKLVAVDKDAGIWVSTDGGGTWSICAGTFPFGLPILKDVRDLKTVLWSPDLRAFCACDSATHLVTLIEDKIDSHNLPQAYEGWASGTWSSDLNCACLVGNQDVILTSS